MPYPEGGNLGFITCAPDKDAGLRADKCQSLTGSSPGLWVFFVFTAELPSFKIWLQTNTGSLSSWHVFLMLLKAVAQRQPTYV